MDGVFADGLVRLRAGVESAVEYDSAPQVTCELDLENIVLQAGQVHCMQIQEAQAGRTSYFAANRAL